MLETTLKIFLDHGFNFVANPELPVKDKTWKVFLLESTF